MADYYPLIARAIAGLDPSAPGESRRALYERARAALIAQLRSVQPPLSESEITRERLSLEEAVRKVESEAAQRAREARSARRRRRRAGDAFRRATPRSADGAATAQPAGRAGAAAAALGAANAAAFAQRPPAARAGGSAGSAAASGPAARAPMRRSSRPAAVAAATVRPQPQISMQEPQLPPVRDGAPAVPRPPRPRQRRSAGRRACAASATSRPMPTISAAPRRRPTAPRARPTPTCRRPRRSSTGSSRASRPRRRPSRLIPMTSRSRRPSATRRLRRPRRARGSAPIAIASRSKRARAGAVFPFKSAIAVGVVLILVGAAILWGKSVVTGVSGLFKSQPVVERRRTLRRRCPSRRFPIGSASRPVVGQPVAPVAQRVVLYDEDPSDPKGKQYVGSVIWRTEPIKATGDAEARYRRARRHRNSRPQVQDDDVVPPQHRLIAAGEPHRGTDLHPAAGFRRRRRRQRAGHPDEVQRAGARHAAGRARGEGHRRLLPGRPVQCRRRPRAQHPAPEGALVVRRAAGLYQPAPRHHRDREGRAGRTRLQRRLRGCGASSGAGRLRPIILSSLHCCRCYKMAAEQARGGA